MDASGAMPSPFVILREIYGGDGDDVRNQKFQGAWVITSSIIFNLCIFFINCFGTCLLPYLFSMPHLRMLNMNTIIS